MSDVPQPTDKMPLKDFLGQIVEAVLATGELAMTKHSNWKFGKVDIVVRCVCKPMQNKDGSYAVYADIDEPAKAPITEFPMTISPSA